MPHKQLKVLRIQLLLVTTAASQQQQLNQRNIADFVSHKVRQTYANNFLLSHPNMLSLHKPCVIVKLNVLDVFFALDCKLIKKLLDSSIVSFNQGLFCLIELVNRFFQIKLLLGLYRLDSQEAYVQSAVHLGDYANHKNEVFHACLCYKECIQPP